MNIKFILIACFWLLNYVWFAFQVPMMSICWTAFLLVPVMLFVSQELMLEMKLAAMGPHTKTVELIIG